MNRRVVTGTAAAAAADDPGSSHMTTLRPARTSVDYGVRTSSAAAAGRTVAKQSVTSSSAAATRSDASLRSTANCHWYTSPIHRQPLGDLTTATSSDTVSPATGSCRTHLTTTTFSPAAAGAAGARMQSSAASMSNNSKHAIKSRTAAALLASTTTAASASVSSSPPVNGCLSTTSAAGNHDVSAGVYVISHGPSSTTSSQLDRLLRTHFPATCVGSSLHAAVVAAGSSARSGSDSVTPPAGCNIANADDGLAEDNPTRTAFDTSRSPAAAFVWTSSPRNVTSNRRTRGVSHSTAAAAAAAAAGGGSKRHSRPTSTRSSSSSASNGSSFDWTMYPADDSQLGFSAAATLLSSPYQLEISRLRLDQLRIEEDHLLEQKRQSELERTRGPQPKWYELRSSEFHREVHRNNELMRNRNKWQELLDYRSQLELASHNFQTASISSHELKDQS